MITFIYDIRSEKPLYTDTFSKLSRANGVVLIKKMLSGLYKGSDFLVCIDISPNSTGKYALVFGINQQAFNEITGFEPLSSEEYAVIDQSVNKPPLFNQQTNQKLVNIFNYGN